MNTATSPNDTPPRRYFRYPEASSYSTVSMRQLAFWVSEKKLPVIRAGRSVLIDKQDLDRFLESLKT